MVDRTPMVLLVLFLSFLWDVPAPAKTLEQPAVKGQDDFFIVSSVDTQKQQLVLKQPTEVTELMLVTAKTLCLDAQGKPLPFSDLRAGNTVYVSSVLRSDGMRVATQIRKGAMTLQELRRRYLTPLSF